MTSSRWNAGAQKPTRAASNTERHPILLFEIIGALGVGKTEIFQRIKTIFPPALRLFTISTQSCSTARAITATAAPIKYLPVGHPARRMIFAAALWNMDVEVVTQLQEGALIIAEHFVNFFTTVESFCGGSSDIESSALAVTEPDLVLLLDGVSAAPKNTIFHNAPDLARQMRAGMGELSKANEWTHVHTGGRWREVIARECIRHIMRRLRTTTPTNR